MPSHEEFAEVDVIADLIDELDKVAVQPAIAQLLTGAESLIDLADQVDTAEILD